jgi:hypothetical protein
MDGLNIVCCEGSYNPIDYHPNDNFRKITYKELLEVCYCGKNHSRNCRVGVFMYPGNGKCALCKDTNGLSVRYLYFRYCPKLKYGLQRPDHPIYGIVLCSDCDAKSPDSVDGKDWYDALDNWS